MDALESRLAALENKIKAASLEVEKRLGKLEAEQPESAIGLAEERIQELEDLLLLVQLENTKIKEKMGASADVISAGMTLPDNVESRFSDLQSEIESLKHGGTETEGADAAPEGMESRLAGMEEKISSLASLKGGTVPENLLNAGSQLEEQNRKIQSLEKMLAESKPQAAVSQEDLAGIAEKIKGDMAGEMAKSGKFSGSELQGYLDKLQAERKDLMKDAEILVSLKKELEAVSKDKKDIISKMPQIETAMEKMDSYLSKIQASEERLKAENGKTERSREALQGLIESGKSAEKEIQDYLSKIRDEKSRLAEETEKMYSLKKEMDNAVKDRKDTLQKVSEAEVNLEKADSYFSRIQAVQDKIQADISKIESLKDSIDSRLKSNSEAMESMKAEIESRIKNSDEKIKPRLEKLDSLKESFEAKMSNLEAELEDVKSLGKQFRDVAKISSIEGKLAALSEKIQDIDNLHKDYDEGSIRIASIEKELSKMRTLKQSVEEETLQMVKSRLAEIKMPDVEGLRKNYEEETNRIASIEKEMPDTQTLRQNLEEEIASRASLEKRVDGLVSKFSGSHNEAALQSAAAPLPATANTDDISRLRTEIASQKQTINEMEKRLEKQAIKFFAENLEDFAHALEKRFPRIVREEQYYKDMHAIEQKLRNIQAPDLSPLAARVEMLERHISEISGMMKSFSGRVPMVVE